MCCLRPFGDFKRWFGRWVHKLHEWCVSGQVCAQQAGGLLFLLLACCLNKWQLGWQGGAAAGCMPMSSPPTAPCPCWPAGLLQRATLRGHQRRVCYGASPFLSSWRQAVAGSEARSGGAGPQGRLWRLLAAAQPARTPLGPTWANVASFHTCWQLDDVVHCQSVLSTLQRMPHPLPECAEHLALPASCCIPLILPPLPCLASQAYCLPSNQSAALHIVNTQVTGVFQIVRILTEASLPWLGSTAAAAAAAVYKWCYSCAARWPPATCS
jgi:hypothetical protein